MKFALFLFESLEVALIYVSCFHYSSCSIHGQRICIFTYWYSPFIWVPKPLCQRLLTAGTVSHGRFTHTTVLMVLNGMCRSSTHLLTSKIVYYIIGFNYKGQVSCVMVRWQFWSVIFFFFVLFFSGREWITTIVCWDLSCPNKNWCADWQLFTKCPQVGCGFNDRTETVVMSEMHMCCIHGTINSNNHEVHVW